MPGKWFKTIFSFNPSINMAWKEHKILLESMNKSTRLEEASFQVPGETFSLGYCCKQGSESMFKNVYSRLFFKDANTRNPSWVEQKIFLLEKTGVMGKKSSVWERQWSLPTEESKCRLGGRVGIILSRFTVEIWWDAILSGSIIISSPSPFKRLVMISNSTA